MALRATILGRPSSVFRERARLHSGTRALAGTLHLHGPRFPYLPSWQWRPGLRRVDRGRIPIAARAEGPTDACIRSDSGSRLTGQGEFTLTSGARRSASLGGCLPLGASFGLVYIATVLARQGS